MVKVDLGKEKEERRRRKREDSDSNDGDDSFADFEGFGDDFG